VSIVLAKEERRNFSRIALDRLASLEVGGVSTACELVDISLRGALVRVPAKLRADAGQECTLTIQLDLGAVLIRMRGAVAHRADRTVGVRCTDIDLDCIAHLRRLLEVNLGDDRLLRRELAALITI
jgi:hypothetical protein